MKRHIFFTLALFFCALALNAQSDFNFAFYPPNSYVKYETEFKKDSTGKFVAVVDTFRGQVAVFIEKTFAKFVIRHLHDMSLTSYESNVRFKGTAADGTLSYESIATAGEMVFVNPGQGRCEIVYQRCFEEPADKKGYIKKYCNETRHVFGNIAPPILPVTDKK